MKQKEELLLRAIGGIDEELVLNAQPRSERGGRIIWWKKGVLAACLCLLVGLGAVGVHLLRPSQMPEPAADTTAEQGENAAVDVADLLPQPGEEVFTEDVLYVQTLPVAGRAAEYYQVKTGSRGNELLSESLGEPLENADNWYRLAGHDELQYLILRGENGYSLWEFACFVVWDEEQASEAAQIEDWGEYTWMKDAEFSPYRYDHVLQTVYGVTGAQDIVSITVTPNQMDNTDAGKALQREIGTKTIADENDIAALYDVISGIICLGGDHWEHIGFNNTNLLEGVRLTRNLTIELADGRTISALKYTAMTNRFYENGGVAYEALSAEDAAAVERILGIER